MEIITSKGQRLKSIRKLLRLTQSDLAIDCDRSTISRYEENKIDIDEEIAKRLVRIINDLIIERKLDHELITTNHILDAMYEINKVARDMLQEFQQDKISTSDNFELLWHEIENITEFYDKNELSSTIKIEAYECFIRFFCEKRKFEFCGGCYAIYRGTEYSEKDNRVH